MNTEAGDAPVAQLERARERVHGWGRSATADAATIRPTSRHQLSAAPLPDGSLIGRGLGRSYGDAATPTDDGTAVVTTACSSVEWVDRESGIIRADAGITIGDLIDRYATKGWFVPVSPGTRNVTIGGAIAADIHGKNHHAHGSFGQHVTALRLRIADGSIIEVGPDQNPDVFWATVGGMGLTGVVVDADIALMAVPSTVVAVETSRLETLPDLLSEMRRSDSLHSFSVAWVDLLTGGRSVLTQGDFAPAVDVDGPAGPRRQPPSPSIGLPNVPIPNLVHRPFMRVFNEAWWRLAPAVPTVTHESITRFWHPLDAVADWNRLYGNRGFWQWQCVVPEEAEDALLDICAQLRSEPAYFSVLKRFGPANPAPLSFPTPGWTLATDLPATKSVAATLNRLDELVVDVGGRLYLAKDSRMSRRTFEAGYPRLDEFRAVRASVDPHGRFSSRLSERLGI